MMTISTRHLAVLDHLVEDGLIEGYSVEHQCERCGQWHDAAQPHVCRAVPGWVHEFGADYDVPDEIAGAGGLVDMSWHNDACPSWGASPALKDGEDVHDLRLWVEHPDPDQRETASGARYCVNYQPWSCEPVPGVTVCDWGEVYEGDDPEAALAAWRAAAEIIRAEVARRVRLSVDEVAFANDEERFGPQDDDEVR